MLQTGPSKQVYADNPGFDEYEKQLRELYVSYTDFWTSDETVVRWLDTHAYTKSLVVQKTVCVGEHETLCVL